MASSDRGQQLLAEIQQNQRLRLGMWAIACILLAYGYLLLDAQEAEAVAEAQRLQLEIRDVTRIATQKHWLDRVDRIVSLRAQAESEFWQSRSEGLAQATFQSWLDRQIHSYNLENTQVRMLPVEERDGALRLWKVSARLQGAFAPREFQRLLLGLESVARVTIVDSLQIRKNRNATFELVVTAWFIREP